MPQRTDRERDYRARNVVACVLNETWAIEPGKFEQIAAFLEMRSAGEMPSEDEIRAAMSMRQKVLATDYVHGVEPRNDDRIVVDGVEVMQLFGVLGPRMNLMTEFSGGTSTQKFGQEFDRAMADPGISAVLFEVDSPGGVMTGTDELRNKIFQARGKKPIKALGRGQVASAAYYVATAADELIVTSSTEVGSIGVFAVTNDKTAMYEQLGVKFHVWRAGENKYAGNPYETVTEDRRKVLQARVEGPYQMFIQAVAANRGVSVEKVEKEFGQGTSFIASESLRRGMVDRIATLEQVLGELRASAAAKKTAISYPTGSSRAAFASQPILEKESSFMDPKIKAALFAMGMIGDINASDDICQAVLGGVFRGSVPKAVDEILKGITQGSATAVATATGPLVAEVIKPAEGTAAPNVQAAKDREIAEAKAAERSRIAAIHAKANIFKSTGFAVDAAAIQKAIEDGISPAEAADRWTSSPPVTNSQYGREDPIGRIAATGSEVDQFVAAASDGLLLRSVRQKLVDLPEGYKPAAGADQVSRMSAMQIATRDLQMAGRRIDPNGSAEDTAAEWLRMQGEFRMYAAEGGVTAGNYPNLLAGFMSKTLDTVGQVRQSTYREWTAQHPSVPDFNPRLIVGQGSVGYLPEIPGDGDPTPETSTAEEPLAWFQVHRRGEKLKLTPYMVTQDMLNAFADSFGKLQLSQDKTIDRMAIDLLVSNPVMIDGVALFHADHENLIASGGAAPSATTAKANRLMMRTQKEIGGNDPLELEPRVTFVPDELEEAAIQTFYSTAKLTEIIMKSTDAGVNIYRNANNTVISSQRLSAASAVAWYQFANPQIMPVIKRVYQTGYENGRRESWWDPDTQCRYFRFEIRLAVFVAGHRGVVKNPGQ
jgi:signal peptide peptidase SppA